MSATYGVKLGSDGTSQPKLDAASEESRPFDVFHSPGDKQAGKELSSQDLVELTSFSQKKEEIDQKTVLVMSWPELDAFRDVSTHSADPEALRISRLRLKALDRELSHARNQREQLEAAVQLFNVHDMTRLRTVAKEISHRHLSPTDTDLIELALHTVYALDKLVRLLRSHKIKHDLAEMRLRWESMLCTCWEDLLPLQEDVAAFGDKCDRLALCAPPQPQGNVKRDINAKELQHKRSSSSWRMTAEAIRLESSRLALRIGSFTSERVLPTGRLLDSLIDQRQIPENLIDEQERLEEAIPSALKIEEKAAGLAAALQWDLPSTARQPEQHKTAEESLRLPTQFPAQRSPSSSKEASARRSDTVMGAYKADNNVATPKTSVSKPTGTTSLLASPMPVTYIGPNQYESDPRDKLDVAVGNIVNRMPIKVSVVPVGAGPQNYSNVSSESVDLSGRYWVGHPQPRLCFCRFLKSHTVMVRVGGGWQELSHFITQHYSHLTNTSPSGLSRARTPLRALVNNPSTPQTPWLRSASGPADPFVSTRARSKQSVKAHHTPTRARVVTMPVSSSPIPLIFDKSRQSHRNPTSLSLTHADDIDQSAEPISRLSVSGSSGSIVINDAQ